MRFPLVLFLAATLGLVAQDQPILNEDIGIVRFEVLAYPLLARATHAEGAVVVRVKVDSDGKIASATAISGPKALITDCMANAKKWLFRPEKSRDVVIVYIFKFEGLCYSSCPSSFHFSPPNVATITVGEGVVQY
jgi:TonB family protein